MVRKWSSVHCCEKYYGTWG